MASVVGLSMKRVKSKADASKKADNKLSAKKGSERASKKPRKLKAAKDPNKPKRPPSAFFVFMEEFRKSFKEKNPNNKSVSVVNSSVFSTDPSVLVGKAGGDKWKSMSEDVRDHHSLPLFRSMEKVPYVTKAAKLKTEYTKKLTTYNNNQVQFPIDLFALVQPFHISVS
ncbi:hypothetical protein C4D60_Mb07t10190 [Musa balbisiana]|uniref:HMG box domain-containing protein n=1 Tax=Musa balbisiana TaxID=52838 RepID=A0A4S8JEV1_MUSBA|nr:hypothetical protein C4D60_Mb07t10190 [Musa balbisiana]